MYAIRYNIFATTTVDAGNTYLHTHTYKTLYTSTYIWPIYLYMAHISVYRRLSRLQRLLQETGFRQMRLEVQYAERERDAYIRSAYILYNILLYTISRMYYPGARSSIGREREMRT